MFDLCFNRCKNEKKKCVPHIVPSYIITASFILGLFSATAFRILLIFNHIKPSLVRPTWYIGTIGYLFFFLYRYYISCKRKVTINNFDLVEKISKSNDLTLEERNATVYLLQSIRKSRENLNYLWIFITSIIAIIVDIVLTLKGL